MSRRWAVVAAVLLVVTSAACGASTAPTSRWASPAELSWLQTYGSWNSDIYSWGGALDAELQVVYADAGTKGMPAVIRAARLLARCSATIDRAIGKPPTPRLAAVLRLVRLGCANLQSVARTIDADPRHTLVLGTLKNELTDRLDRGWRLLDSAFNRSKLGESQPLAVLEMAPRATRVSYTSPAFNRVASALARKPVTVHCWSVADWRNLGREIHALRRGPFHSDTIGWTEVDGSTIELAPVICRQLSLLLTGATRPYDFWQAEAVKTLAHESQHARGIAAEAVAECFAIQLVPRAADELGLSHEVGNAMSVLMWNDYNDEPPAYKTNRCHDGGQLDLHPRSSEWP